MIEIAVRPPCFSLARAGKKTARAADIGIAGLFIVGIAVLVIDHDRFAACLAGMMMFRCNGRLDGRRCNQRRAKKYDKRLSHLGSSLPLMQREVWSTDRNAIISS